MDGPSSLEEIRKIADDALVPVVGGFKSVALVGFPDHSNVGDSAIWLGELAYLSRRSIRVAYSCSTDTYSKESLAMSTAGGALILVHGGGYFGDTWRVPFEFLLRVVTDFPDRSIVVMPQTIYFRSRRMLDEARQVINAHGSLTLCVRDAQSESLAREFFEHPVVLCPDSAVFLNPGVASGGRGVLYLARGDREAPSNSSHLTAMGVKKRDWTDSRPPVVATRVLKAVANRSKAKLYARIRSSSTVGWQGGAASTAQTSMSRLRVRRGARLLSSAEVVVTDRLHAHVLSTLLGIPNVVLDNSYGKVRAYYETWSRDLPMVYWASDPDEAFAIAEGLVQKTLRDRKPPPH